MGVTVTPPIDLADTPLDLDALARNPEAVRRAEAFLMDAHGHGKRGVDQLHAHAIALEEWHPWPPTAETVALACVLERERTTPSAAVCGINLCPTGRLLFARREAAYMEWRKAGYLRGGAEFRRHWYADKLYRDHRETCGEAVA